MENLFINESVIMNRIEHIATNGEIPDDQLISSFKSRLHQILG